MLLGWFNTKCLSGYFNTVQSLSLLKDNQKANRQWQSGLWISLSCQGFWVPLLSIYSFAFIDSKFSQYSMLVVPGFLLVRLSFHLVNLCHRLIGFWICWSKREMSSVSLHMRWGVMSCLARGSSPWFRKYLCSHSPCTFNVLMGLCWVLSSHKRERLSLGHKISPMSYLKQIVWLYFMDS